MALTYSYGNIYSGLAIGSIGAAEETNNDHWLDSFGIISSVIEIGVGVIVSAATFNPVVGAIASGAIGLGFASARYGVSSARGEDINPWLTALDFALPLGSSLVSGTRAAASLAEAQAALGRTGATLAGAATAAARNADNAALLARGANELNNAFSFGRSSAALIADDVLSSALTSSDNIADIIKNIEKVQNLSIFKLDPKQLSNLAKNINSVGDGILNVGRQVAETNFTLLNQGIRVGGDFSNARNIFSSASFDFFVRGDIVSAATSLGRIGVTVGELATQSDIENQLIFLGFKNQDLNLFRQFVSAGLSFDDAIRSTFASMDLNSIRLILEGANIASKNLDRLGGVVKLNNALINQMQGLDLTLDTIRISKEPTRLQKFIRAWNFEKNGFNLARKKVELTTHKTTWETLKGREFYDVVARRVQWLKPTDAARDVTTPIYRSLTKGIPKKIKAVKESMALNYPRLHNAIKQIGKVATKTQDIREAFVASGGISLGSQWILGYKVIDTPKSSAFLRIVQISFDPSVTNSKAPVFVTTNDKELLNFSKAVSPGEFYLNTWALARNGIPGKGADIAKLNKFIAKLNPITQSLIPIQFLRSFTSITSTLTKFGNDVATKGFGAYLDNYLDRFKDRFVSQTLTRVGRLAGTTFGAVAGSSLIKRETQRTVNTILREVQAQIDFKNNPYTPTGRLRYNAGWQQRLGKAMLGNLQQGAMTALRRYALTRSRYTTNGTFNTAIMRNRILRKSRIVQRTWTSFMPNHGIKAKYRLL